MCCKSNVVVHKVNLKCIDIKNKQTGKILKSRKKINKAYTVHINKFGRFPPKPEQCNCLIFFTNCSNLFLQEHF